MRSKFSRPTVSSTFNIQHVVQLQKSQHKTLSYSFQFSNHDHQSHSSSFKAKTRLITGLVALSAGALLVSADSEEPFNPKSYSRLAYLTNMETLISSHYPRISDLPEELLTLIINQLDWVQQNTQFTPQASVIYDADDKNVNISNHLNREILRALTRIEMLLLITQTDLNHADQLDQNYRIFTQDQPETEKISYYDFCMLIKEFRLIDQEIDAQIRATLIGAVTLSPTAKNLVAQSKYAKDCPYDSVQFSGFTMTLMPEMYPAFSSASKKVQQLIILAFPNDKQHWRHMFYLENNSAFQDFERANMSPEAMSFWKHYWLINAFGFNGHIKLGSAVFFDKSVALRANLLHEAMELRAQNMSINTAKTYATLCAKHLKINANEDQALLLTRIMTMINLMTPTDAKNMYNALQKYPDHQDLVELHKITFHTETMVTYLPALLFNVWSLNHQMSEVIAAFHWANKIIPEWAHDNPLSFRLMDRIAVQNLIACEFSHDSIAINERGEISVLSPVNAYTKNQAN